MHVTVFWVVFFSLIRGQRPTDINYVYNYMYNDIHCTCFLYYYDTECNGGKYGNNCSSQCGACLDYTQCHHVNGSCLQGCDAGYKGELCKTGKAERASNIDYT
jgi:hypothetical protein